jgi:2-C-methyl-D-erythritol 4-phosphate cytidylyltransferase / 2-C-methyl-D-erythritol 2,4-cyclodiphosphate synthase
MQTAALIVAAGRGRRAGGSTPKQYMDFSGEPVLRRTLRFFASSPKIDQIVAVIHPDDADSYRQCVSGVGKCMPPVWGGATRQQSVLAGLEVMEKSPPKFVLVHDAVRPLLSAPLLARALDAVSATGAAVPVVPVNDTIKRVGGDGNIAGTLDRTELRAIQTPQAFTFTKLIEAHRRAAKAGRGDFTDDAAIAEWAGIPVSTFPGESRNLKLTTADDFLIAQALLGNSMEVRTGTGFDVHAFGAGNSVTLGGISIPHQKALIGHSDADVLLHAMTDAVLGALGEPDIGHHFPPSDEKWRGAASDRFLAHAIALLAARGGGLVHLDSTVLCEAPKIGPHRDAIQNRVAEIAGVAAGRVSVKATTTEGLGFIGRGEGIAAMATATIKVPASTS